MLGISIVFCFFVLGIFRGLFFAFIFFRRRTFPWRHKVLLGQISSTASPSAGHLRPKLLHTSQKI